ncbi:MAG: hypothetical protein Q8T11_18630 [Elusimicrobiota bacterium]|nr:hypothetical protein [Elusimicrobiota bacterium]
MAKRVKFSTATLDGVSGKHNEMRAVPSRPGVRVECPGEGEEIAGTTYSFHIAAAPGTLGVEISIDQGEWLPCREALGLWWYDWTGFSKGGHQAAARAFVGEGIMASSSPRLFSAI